ncbi:hypothetical protein QBC45DRAFT_75343 [Copromyces sp. CBS 386.78]|nr:hypothetical protein QBC45DRAFT_75343 [Copromyces sp. CBS 386.78]
MSDLLIFATRQPKQTYPGILHCTTNKASDTWRQRLKISSFRTRGRLAEGARVLLKVYRNYPSFVAWLQTSTFPLRPSKASAKGARKLETISLDGTLIHDAYLMSLAKLPRLKELDVTGGAEFASVGLLKFIMRMETDSNGQRGGFSLSIAKQGVELNEAHEVHLRDEIKRAGVQRNVPHRVYRL